jgi:hypothetical protein
VILELRPFVSAKRNCLGAQTVPWGYWRGPPQAEKEHPALQNWQIDQPEIWKIAHEDRDFAAAKFLRLQITSVTWLRQEDKARETDCDRTVFNPGSGKPQRLSNEPGNRTVAILETAWPSKKWPTPEYCFGIPFEGRYLIADAATGDEIERGNYFYCQLDEE